MNFSAFGDHPVIFPKHIRLQALHCFGHGLDKKISVFCCKKNLWQQGLQEILIIIIAITILITIILLLGPPEVLLYLAEGCWGGRSGEQHIARGEGIIFFWFDFQHILITVFWSKSCRSPTSWSSYWTPKFPTAATTSTRSSRWRLVFEILRRLIIVGNNHQHHQMLDQADRASCSRSVWCWRSLWSWSNVGVDGLYNDYNQKLTKLTSIRRVASMEGKRRGLSILRRWSGEASDPRYIQIFHSDRCDHCEQIFHCDQWQP